MVYKSQQSGFALLVSLVVVGSILSVGLVILDLSIKQVRLAATTKDSEIAFHAANAGMECARYWRRQESDDMETGINNIPIDCFGQSDSMSSVGGANDTGDGDTFVYDYEFSWNGDERCSSVRTIVAVADIGLSGLQVTNMQTLIPGYPEASLDCDAGARCTVVAVQGYNKQCSQKADFGTIEREILLKF